MSMEKLNYMLNIMKEAKTMDRKLMNNDLIKRDLRMLY
jgi:hypothetical protein